MNSRIDVKLENYTYFKYKMYKYSIYEVFKFVSNAVTCGTVWNKEREFLPFGSFYFQTMYDKIPGMHSRCGSLSMI